MRGGSEKIRAFKHIPLPRTPFFHLQTFDSLKYDFYGKGKGFNQKWSNIFRELFDSLFRMGEREGEFVHVEKEH